jgi:hypothetical protein
MKLIARPDQFIIEDVGHDVIVYDRITKKAHSLNPSVAWIWRQCDGKTDIDQLSARFERHFNTTKGVDLVLAGLEQLKTAGLLQIEGNSLSPKIGPMISRRSALAAGSALFPLIATVLVPSAAAAKSGGKGDKGDKGGKGDKGDKGGKGGKGRKDDKWW